ncbi:MAG: helix-turn-helix domain-containing protein [Chloroflexi bacterium]|nr:helix-turn-helix domain-containing protein [Chloroflexota bacterium]
MENTLVLSVSEAGRLLGLSRGSAYLAVKNGELPCIRVGHRLLVPKAALARMLAQAEQADAKEEAGTQRPHLDAG